MGVSVTYYRNRNENDNELFIEETIDDPTVNVLSIAEVNEETSDAFTNGWFIFDKWNTARDGSGTNYAAGDTISSNTMLYAIWKEAQPYVVRESQMTAIADVIREKTGGSAGLEFPDDFLSAIDSITGQYANENLIVPTNARVSDTNMVQSLFTKSAEYNSFGYFYVNSSVQKTFYMIFIPLFDIEVWVNESPNTKYTLEAGKQYSYTCSGYKNNNNDELYQTTIHQSDPYTTICGSGDFKFFYQSRINFKKKVT